MFSNYAERHYRNNSLSYSITNQAGIGRGYYSEEDFDILNNWMCNIFLANDIVITKVYYSPFHPIHGIGKYRKRRKLPQSEARNDKAEKEFQLCLSQSALIGDNLTDIHGINCRCEKKYSFSFK